MQEDSAPVIVSSPFWLWKPRFRQDSDLVGVQTEAPLPAEVAGLQSECSAWVLSRLVGQAGERGPSPTQVSSLLGTEVSGRRQTKEVTGSVNREQSLWL